MIPKSPAWCISLRRIHNCALDGSSGTKSSSTQGPWNSAALSEKVANPTWQSKPSWLIVDANDRMVRDSTNGTAQYIHAKVTTLAAGHVPMLSILDRVAAVIIDAANSSVK